MSHVSTDSDNGSLALKYQSESNSMGESSSGGSISGGDGNLKKGPWTSAEDEILKDYVKKHGEGNWNAVQKHSGLLRCGKSCRLRWTNHLRPNLKKGPFSEEEEELIVELHSKMGNKWARMATHLPGRTDNEIKNFWNTRLKRRQRAGLPIYPPHIAQAKQGNMQNNEPPQQQSQDFGDSIFKRFKASTEPLSHALQFPDSSYGHMLNQGLGYQTSGFITQTGDFLKYLQDSEALFPFMDGNATYGRPAYDQFPIPERIYRPSARDFPHDPDPGSGSFVTSAGMGPGGRLYPVVNFSTSQPSPVAEKSELPSLQYSEPRLGSWPRSSSASIEAPDDHVDSPEMVSATSDCVSTRNSGLLETVIHESKALASEKNRPAEMIPYNPTTPLLDPANAWKTDMGGSADPLSAFDSSTASVFFPLTRSASGSSLDESAVGRTSNDWNVMSEVNAGAVLPVAHEAAQPDTSDGDDFIRSILYDGNSRDHFYLGPDFLDTFNENGVHMPLGLRPC